MLQRYIAVLAIATALLTCSSTARGQQAIAPVPALANQPVKASVAGLPYTHAPVPTGANLAYIPSPCVGHCGFSANNPPAQPQVAKGRCQYCGVAVDCVDECGGQQQTWGNLHSYNFGPLAHGEWLGPVRLPSAVENRIRVGDSLRFVYITAREALSTEYKLQIGDTVHITSALDEQIEADATIQQNGKVYVKLVHGGVLAAGLTIPQLEQNLEAAYLDMLKQPAISVTPVKTNTLLTDIRDAVDARFGQGGQGISDTVNPDGTIRLPKLGAVCVQGLTLDEIKREINLRYRHIVAGLEVEPILDGVAQHFVFVFGEVATPDRYELLGPTTVTQALAMAGGVNRGGNNRQIVIFRRAEDYRLVATILDLRGAHLGKDPIPNDEIWLRDGDLIIVPKTPIQRFDDFVQQVFTNGIYGMFPFSQVGSGLEIGAGIQ